MIEGSVGPGWNDGVRALMTTRADGFSAGRHESLNLGAHVGDDPAHVAANRVRFAAAIGAAPVYLNQVHGTRVVRLVRADACDGAPLHEADAAVTSEPGIACTVLVADCLPVLLAAPRGSGVAAVHAGWRGMAAGVIEAALAALCDTARCEPSQVRAWLGASIGARRFEVGDDVVYAFGASAGSAAFVPAPAKDGRPKWLADLPRLARERLAACGVREVGGGEHCTVEDRARFFSFRRDGVTGRMAAAVWIEQPAVSR